MGKNPSRMVYKRKWRQIEKRRKRCNAFITEYTRLKFGNVYNEAVCFYNALEQMYPDKVYVKKTKEFKTWKEALINTENPESNIIVQTLYTSVSYGGKQPKATNDESYNNSEEAAESDTESDNNGEKAAESDTESDNNGEKAAESDTESDNNGEKAAESDTEEEGFETSNNYENQSPYRDNMLLEIPLEKYLPPDHQDKNTQTTVSETEPDYDYEVFSDERFQQIVAELRNDPELRNIFGEPENLMGQEEEDEGVELRTLEEELEVDIEPFDYRLEVELSDWESQL